VNRYTPNSVDLQNNHCWADMSMSRQTFDEDYHTPYTGATLYAAAGVVRIFNSAMTVSEPKQKTAVF